VLVLQMIPWILSKNPSNRRYRVSSSTEVLEYWEQLYTKAMLQVARLQRWDWRWHSFLPCHRKLKGHSRGMFFLTFTEPTLAK